MTQTTVQKDPADEALPTILTESSYLRIWQIIGDRKRNTPGLIPMGRTSFFDKVRTGEFPKPVKVGRSSFWRTSDIKELITKLGNPA
jgi:predicted DNA-binding transcriptional regulator AlpA